MLFVLDLLALNGYGVIAIFRWFGLLNMKTKYMSKMHFLRFSLTGQRFLLRNVDYARFT